MSFQPPPRPETRRKARPKRPEAPRAIPWGWLEWFVVSQSLIPALLFVPGMNPIRTITRIAVHGVAPLAWVVVAWSGKTGPDEKTFPARPWLMICAVWIGLSILHPDGYSLITSLAQAGLYLSVISPAFWAPSALRSSRQLTRVIALLFLCNALSASLGVAQVFRPEVFNPPVIPEMNNQFQGQNHVYQADDGRSIMRPCGLSDSPGGASAAGLPAALLGLCWALRPVAIWKRLASLGLAFLGVAVIYYSQVRVALVMLAVCLAVLAAMLALQRNYRQALMLAAGGAGLVGGALAWVSRSAGSVITDRFLTLLQSNPGELYGTSRGAFVREAFEELLWRYPLGYGMGWWGMSYALFGRPLDRPSPIWVEVMWPAWIVDGGMPLLIGYAGAIAAAMFDSARIALTSPDAEVAFWGAVIVAFNLSVVAACFSYVAFLTPIGAQFWLLAAALHAADRRARLARREASR